MAARTRVSYEGENEKAKGGRTAGCQGHPALLRKRRVRCLINGFRKLLTV